VSSPPKSDRDFSEGDRNNRKRMKMDGYRMLTYCMSSSLERLESFFQEKHQSFVEKRMSAKEDTKDIYNMSDESFFKK